MNPAFSETFQRPNVMRFSQIPSLNTNQPDFSHLTMHEANRLSILSMHWFLVYLTQQSCYSNSGCCVLDI